MNNPEELNPYYRAQEKIYKALMQRHEADDNFRFTLRKIYNKNTYKNYFTGTEKSSYITFSLWYVKYAYPGASIDPLVFVANQIKGKWKIKLQLFQTKSPNDNQNTWVLKLLENINIQITTSGLLDNYSREESNKSNKMFRVFLLPKENRIKEENLSNRLLQLIDDITPIVNTEITKLKRLHPTFIGNSVTADEFSKMISDRERRSQKVKNSIPTFEEVVQEVINIDSIEEESLFQFNEIHNGYSWVGDSLDVIGDRRAHYEIQKSGERDAYVFVHFEDEYCEKIKELIGNDLPKDLSWYEWEKGEGIRVRGFEMLREPGTPNMLYEKLKYLEENLGGRIRKVLQEISPIITKENIMKTPVNKILYGPPGTGKTYKTKKLAIEIIEGVEYSDSKEDRLLILEKYEEFVQSQNIKFTTFHQSMSYEDFVEGIKPETNENNDVIYSVQDGIFKTVCNAAIQLDKIEKTDELIDFTTKTFFKMSLGGKNRKEIHDWCIENNYISLGWGGNNNYSVLSSYNRWDDFKENFILKYPDLDADSSFNKQAIYCFQHWMRIGDVVVATLGNNIVDAIGIVEGDYEYDENKEIPYNHFRKVKWLATNLNASPKLFIDKNISQQSIYKFNDEDVKFESFKEKFSSKKNKSPRIDNHVLIIDEINRGNVSAIFGELITLLEADKRKGCQEEVNLTLPYSKENFSVPSNVYVIGTMNTADRSVEALDTALRRRFSFEELLPNPSLLSDSAFKDVNLVELLKAINQRIELLIDKDHQIGHSYFFNVTSIEDLKFVFKDKIIPLLEEYFYGDFGKIGLVLGEAFIEKNKTASKDILAKFSAYEEVDFLTEKQLFRLKDIQAMDVSAFVSVYEPTEG